MGNSTPQDRPQDEANQTRASHLEPMASSSSSHQLDDFLETEEDPDLNDIDWSMLTDLSTKITNSNLDASTAKQSDLAGEAAQLDPLDPVNWLEESDDSEASLAEMMDLESLDDLEGDLASEFGLEDFNADIDADITEINVSKESQSSSNAFEFADLDDAIDDLIAEASATSASSTDEDISWNITEQDLQEFANPTKIYNADASSGFNDTSADLVFDPQSFDAVDAQNFDIDAGYEDSYKESGEDYAQQSDLDSYDSHGANFADLPDYYADEDDQEPRNRNPIQVPNQKLRSDFEEDILGEEFEEALIPQDIPDVQMLGDISAAYDDMSETSDWELANASQPEISTPEISQDFDELDAEDEDFLDSTRIESSDRSSERYSADWEQELGSSYYAETTEQELLEAFNADFNIDADSEADAAPDISETDRFSDAHTADTKPTSLPSLPSLPPLPTLPPLPPLNSPVKAKKQPHSAASNPEVKPLIESDQFDLPDIEWTETVSPRLGENTKDRKAGSSDSSNPGQSPLDSKVGPTKGTSEYKKLLSENVSADMSWSEILDMQPGISGKTLEEPDWQTPDSSTQTNHSIQSEPKQKKVKRPNILSDMPIDRVEQMGAFSDFADIDFDLHGLPGDMADMAESGEDEFIPDRRRPARHHKSGVNLPELWDSYGKHLKIPAIALGAIAAVVGFFSIPPIKRFTVETSLRIGFNKDASGQDLTGVNFKGGNLEKVNFTNANLTNANLEAVNFKGTTLIGAKLDGANLQKADLKGARLVDASLVGTNLASATLNLADLSNADLTKANLSKANMNGALLKGSKIDLQDPKSATKLDPEDLLMWQIVNEPRVNRNLAGINMTGFNLNSAKLQGAKLADAKLAWSDLSQSDLSNAKLDRTDMSGANLQGANLQGANLAQATWGKDRAPKTDSQTICPNGAKGPCKF